MQPGPLIGKVLDALLEAVTDDPSVNERETLLRLARALLDRLSDPGKKA
jgi:hypothetical protein